MKTIQMLEESDTILPTDFCRPLALERDNNGYGDAVHETSCYSGLPINNLKWLPVHAVLGDCWFGKTVREFNVNGFSKNYSHHETAMEFVRGNIPTSHLLSVKS
jgi:hypothetical protein